MSGTPWTKPELRDLEKFANDWPAFHNRHPTRTYDAFEVKRRRIAGASAGRGRASARSVSLRLADSLAERVLRVLEEYLAERSMDESA